MEIFIYSKATLHVSGVTAPIFRSIKTVPAASGTGHNTGTATPLQRGLIGTAFRSDHVAFCCICWIFIHIELRCTEP